MQPTILFVKDLIDQRKLKCHVEEEKCKLKGCDFLSGCNGHGKCSDKIDKCLCNEGWTGADCSAEIKFLDTDFI